MNTKLSILCVDDEPLNLMLLGFHFESKFNFFSAGSGSAGLEILKSHPDIKIVLSDMKMPGMNGLEFITKAKQEFPHIIYIILTGFDITEEIQNAITDHLIHKYFRKPYNIKEIEEAIRTAINV